MAGQYGRIAQLALSGQWDPASTTLFRPGDMLLDAVTGGLASAAGYKIGQIFKNLKGMGQCSFSEDTPVTTEDGLQPISELEIGDKVLAYNEETGEIGYYPVTATWFHDDPVIVHLTLDGEEIETTPEHPFYTAAGVWVAAEDLQVGDEIQRADGTTGTLEKIEIENHIQPMYNLTVAAAHTYFVGEGEWLVHNACPQSAIRKIEEHLNRFGPDAPNSAMIQRLKAGKWSAWDQRFAEHELLESVLMGKGLDHETAHLATLQQQGIAWEPGYEAYLYHPDIINGIPDYFSFAAQKLAKILSGR